VAEADARFRRHVLEDRPGMIRRKIQSPSSQCPSLP
jgi:hypothetical protein